ncbi:Mlp family lipoprotein [Borrelia miyamotoi]|uniref:Mlp family lipoprotein n=1 Tax=Borrelia miyamotoi TaxID=47466 RepID=UPI002362A721|nr:Mlp family lipoprotein [Borrelia miyamotoi]ATQ20445.2 Mlp family lipoprotein [Borrelia miyamotoi]WDS47510.1 Mlp family lipoprotein [Borrelia miyamotoi]
MRRINVVLILSLLISSCGQNELTNSSKETKSRSKRELSEEQVIVKKTSEEILREKLNEEEKTNLDFLKEALGDNDKFNQFVLLNENKVKDALEHIKTQVEQCNGNEDGKKNV